MVGTARWKVIGGGVEMVNDSRGESDGKGVNRAAALVEVSKDEDFVTAGWGSFGWVLLAGFVGESPMVEESPKLGESPVVGESPGGGRVAQAGRAYAATLCKSSSRFAHLAASRNSKDISTEVMNNRMSCVFCKCEPFETWKIWSLKENGIKYGLVASQYGDVMDTFDVVAFKFLLPTTISVAPNLVAAGV